MIQLRAEAYVQQLTENAMAKTSPGADVERPCLPRYRRRDKRTRGMVRGMPGCQRGDLGIQVCCGMRFVLRYLPRSRYLTT